MVQFGNRGQDMLKFETDANCRSPENKALVVANLCFNWPYYAEDLEMVLHLFAYFDFGVKLRLEQSAELLPAVSFAESSQSRLYLDKVLWEPFDGHSLSMVEFHLLEAAQEHV